MKQQSYDLSTKSAVTVLQRARKENPAAGWARGMEFGMRYGVSAELNTETCNSPWLFPVRKKRGAGRSRRRCIAMWCGKS